MYSVARCMLLLSVFRFDLKQYAFKNSYYAVHESKIELKDISIHKFIKSVNMYSFDSSNYVYKVTDWYSSLYDEWI